MSTTEFFPSAVWQRKLRDSDIDARAKALGLWMSVYADPKTGEMFPSIASLQLLIVNEEGKPFSRSTIQRARALLVAEDWLELVKPGKGRGVSSVYRLTFPNGKRISEAAENASENASEGMTENASGQMHQVQQEVNTSRSLGNGSVGGSIERVHLTTTTEAHPPFGSSEQKIAEWYAQQDKANNGNSAVSSLAASTAVRRCAVCDSGEMVYFDGPNKGKLVPSSRLHEHEGVYLHDHCATAAVSQ